MDNTIKALGIDRMDIDERLALAEKIWATICADVKALALRNEQRAKLDRRVADDDTSPDDVMPWDEVKESVHSRIGC
mgnify:CR=1 FL=1